MAATQPTLIPEAWASQGSRTTIPDTTSETGRASWALGFPPETALPLGAGGVPPHWLDFQGVLYALSSHACFAQQGGRYGWQSTLDYPAGACILGSDGKVYQAIQASGPGTAAGAKNPANGANPSYWGVAATPDGSTIQVVGGKLAVNSAGVAPLLADGVTTVNNSGKITVDLSNATAAALKKISQYVAKSDGGLRMDTATGKLVVDFSLMPTDAFRQIVLDMVQAGGGLAVDGNGKLFVDFDTMPTDKFENLLKSLKMQVPLSANMTVYVATNDASASDAIVDGRGSEAKPFKTIQACVTWLTQNYALGKYNIYVRVKPGTYSETIVLPTFTKTTGSVSILADDASNPPLITNSTPVANLFTVTGGAWPLRNLSLVGSFSAANDGTSHFPNIVGATNGGTTCTIGGCGVSVAYTGASSASGGVLIRCFDATNGAAITMSPLPEYGNTIEYHKNNANSLIVFNATRNGSIILPSTNNNLAITSIKCYGEASTFCSLGTNSLFSVQGGGLYFQTFDVPSGQTATGIKYAVTTGSGVQAPTGGFPGDAAGTVDSTTMSWYTET